MEYLNDVVGIIQIDRIIFYEGKDLCLSPSLQPVEGVGHPYGTGRESSGVAEQFETQLSNKPLEGFMVTIINRGSGILSARLWLSAKLSNLSRSAIHLDETSCSSRFSMCQAGNAVGALRISMTNSLTWAKADSRVAFAAKASLFAMAWSFASKAGETSIWVGCARVSDDSPGMILGFLSGLRFLET